MMKSARQHGCADAEFAIGKNYFDGLGAPKNYGEAYKWFSKAVADGHPHAMNELARMYADGKGVKMDERKAVQLYVEAAKGGCPYAKFNLAEGYRTGAGVPKDIRKASTLFAELANAGDKAAAKKLQTHSVDNSSARRLQGARNGR